MYWNWLRLYLQQSELICSGLKERLFLINVMSSARVEIVANHSWADLLGTEDLQCQQEQ